ncbi:MAG: LytTR family transcriptional regulator DNA-binding domain-containing protein [Saprospiraceae bacterium]|nr:LytTR family transcriptional regulator DNA-binding domain-containing protein [Lewinella sp.]
MFNTILIDADTNKLNQLEEKLQEHCPQLKVVGKSCQYCDIERLVENSSPNLIFIKINKPDIHLFGILTSLSFKGIEFIIISDIKEIAYEALKFSMTGFILRPVDPNELIQMVRLAKQKIQIKKERDQERALLEVIRKKLSINDLIGIPTMEGFEFFKIDDIIRCKGLQKCTQIVTQQRTNIVSSYNIGEFTKLLKPFGFFSPHKSHLVNLSCIKKYLKEGSIVMVDGATVPVSRRRRSEFLEFIKHV